MLLALLETIVIHGNAKLLQPESTQGMVVPILGTTIPHPMDRGSFRQ